MIASRTLLLLLLAGSLAASSAVADPIADLREVLRRYPTRLPFAATVQVSRNEQDDRATAVGRASSHRDR